MPAARKTKPAAVTEQQLVERLCGMKQKQILGLSNRLTALAWDPSDAEYQARRIAAMLVKR